MGAGIALQFKRRYPDMYQEYRRRCAEDTFQLGNIFVWQAGGTVIYNLATQPRPGPSATLDAIRLSVSAALSDASHRNLTRLGIPRVGAGLGGLAWAEVRGMLEDGANASSIELVVVTLPSFATSKVKLLLTGAARARAMLAETLSFGRRCAGLKGVTAHLEEAQVLFPVPDGIFWG